MSVEYTCETCGTSREAQIELDAERWFCSPECKDEWLEENA